jgi:hypothetical protein
MTSLGFSEYAENNNDSTRNGNGNGNGNGNSKIYNRRNGGGSGGNRTLKIPRNIDAGGATHERGLLQSPNGAISGITNENGNNNGMIQQAGKKIKQIKDYIENIHRKGGEDSDDDSGGGDMDSSNILPSYPAQGMGVYATNVSNADIISSNTPFKTGSETVVRKTTQMNSLHPGSSYSSTLLEGMNVSPTPYFEKVTGIPGAPKKDPTVASASNTDKTSTYASQYYEQFVPYAESLAGQLANNSSSSGGGGGGGNMSGTNAALIEKLNYIIHMLEEKKEEKTGHVIEELVLYCFLGVFIIFVVDTFTRAAGVSRGGAAGVGRGGFSMFGGSGGPRRYSHTASVYHR